MTSESNSLLTQLQPLLSMPRETLPQLTAQEARKSLGAVAARLNIEFIEITGVAPTFLLLPPSPPEILIFGTWHAESMPIEPAAVQGAERLALAIALSAAERSGETRTGFVVAPGAMQGSLVLGQVLREHRAPLRAPVALCAERAATGRPLLAGNPQARLADLAIAREPLYARLADAVLDVVPGASPQLISAQAASVVSALEEQRAHH